MAFPSCGILDDFQRANEGPPPSANWTTGWYDSSDGGLRVLSNQCATVATAWSTAYWNAASFGPDVEVYCTIATLPGDTRYVNLPLRLLQVGSGSTVDGYEVYYAYSAGGTDTVNIYRIDNGVETQLGATISQDFIAGDGLGFEAIGSTLTVYQKTGGSWSSLGSRSDATYNSAGRIGLTMRDTTARVDDFSGGTIITAGIANLAMNHFRRLREQS